MFDIKVPEIGDATKEGLFGLSREELVTWALRAQELATIDELTRIPNRRYFESQIASHLAFEGDAHQLDGALLMLDIDLFKQVNDTYGHDVGDDVLHSFAATLQESVRLGDLVARYGGEEFIVFLPRAEEAETEIVAERIRSAIEEMLVCSKKGEPLTVTVSIGVALVNSVGCDLRNLKEAADKALYEAKHTGRNRVVFAGNGLNERRRHVSGGDRRKGEGRQTNRRES